MRHRVYVDVHVAVPGRLEDLWQGRPARSSGENDVGVGDRRVAHPFPVDVPPLASEAGEEHDDRAVDAGRATVEVRLGDPHAAVHAERVLPSRGVLVDQDLEPPGSVRRHSGYLLIAGQPSLEQLVCIRDCDEAETREEHTDRNDPSSGSVHTLSPFPFVLVVRGATASELLGPDRACQSGKRLSAHVFSFDRTSVPAAESMPPMPLTSESFAFGTWRGPHSPRSCRVASSIGKMPYIPVWVYESPPPLVLIGSEPPGVERPSWKHCTPSPRLAKPSDSSMIGG